MAYEPLTPLPFLPIIGRFDLNTFIPGSSDYEIMARVIETYNKAVELFNQIIGQYSDIDKTIEELTKEYQKQLDAYKSDTDQHISAFEQEVNTKVQAQDDKISDLAKTVVKLQKDVDDLINGEYIDNYVKALATWIDNNLQQLVAKVVKYVWFEINESGYFVAYIPDKWDFVNFGTELDPDNEDYGKLVLEWEPEVPADPTYQAFPVRPVVQTVATPNEAKAKTAWNLSNEIDSFSLYPSNNLTLLNLTVNTSFTIKNAAAEPKYFVLICEPSWDSSYPDKFYVYYNVTKQNNEYIVNGDIIKIIEYDRDEGHETETYKPVEGINLLGNIPIHWYFAYDSTGTFITSSADPIPSNSNINTIKNSDEYVELSDWTGDGYQGYITYKLNN